jgi:predicted Zn-dependent peptidase
MNYHKTVLPSGIRVISERVPAVDSVSVGIWVHVGSRNEPAGVSGISHFIEHMLFKGTEKRSALEIARALESLGGSINAFTSREYTCYYVRILGSHLPRAMEILADIINHPALAPSDLRKERQVILEEIKDTIDSPSEYVHDLFVEKMWSDHPLGQPILGTSETIKSMRRPAVLDFLSGHYTSPNIVVAGTGGVSHKALVEMTKKHFPWPNGSVPEDGISPRTPGCRLVAVNRRSKQSHVCLGFPSFGYPDSRRYALGALNTYLSSGMSARLFQKVREEAGFCYNIYSYQESFRDSGFFCVYFSADTKYVIRALRIIVKELRRLKETLLGRAELAKIKEQMKGSLVLSQESMYNRMNRIAQQELFLQSYVDLERHSRIIDTITSRNIREIANQIFDHNRLTVCSLGPTRLRDLQHIRWSAL